MVQVTDPDGTITIDVDPNGELHVDRSRETVFEPSPYGLPTPYGSFPEEFELDDVQTRTIDESYELVHGKQSNPHHRAVEKTLSFESDGGSVDLQVRAADDGIAYRYRLRGERNEYLHPGDESGFRFPPGAVAWLSDYQANHEGHSRQVPVTAIDGEYNLPGLFRVEDTWALVCEAGVDGNWMAGRLVGTNDDAPGVDIGFPDSHPTSHVWADDPVTTPWRVAIIGDLATVVESTLPTDLVDGPRIDSDWVEPGRVAWSWWSSDSSVRSLEEERAYVDYAAERGWEYVLVDAGWDDEWLPDLVAYANDAGVDVELWSHFIDLNAESKREERLSRWAEWGVAGIKVDFMDSDDQGRMQFYDDLARAAAEYELTVDFHGSAVPTGLRRRWPHIMTYEGVRGAEYYKWTTNTPEHNATLPFTRNVVGPMDYTPVTFSADRRATSAGHELALSVVYESGLQHYADGIETYESYPIAERVLEAVPAAWDETKFLRGRPGSEATFARRKGDDWFVGSITAGPACSIAVPLSFLDGETTAVVATDADEGTGLEEYERAVSPDESLRVSTAGNGGFVVRL
ncbi:glycoside hydrolase family 97 protein [Haloterrigena salifodinae]|uniref:glycoside hydrolase family 97 protein n=1 Tax=Haloterrigena salifodinae TaxID=2675099 RepID=UPI000F86F26B|nr:glycoside hydrolase family 97 protein [Haloterrigena salifodinae]